MFQRSATTQTLWCLAILGGLASCREQRPAQERYIPVSASVGVYIVGETSGDVFHVRGESVRFLGSAQAAKRTAAASDAAMSAEVGAARNPRPPVIDPDVERFLTEKAREKVGEGDDFDRALAAAAETETLRRELRGTANPPAVKPSALDAPYAKPLDSAPR